MKDEPRIIRIEVLHDLKKDEHGTTAYIAGSFTIQRTGSSRERVQEQLWVDFELPWTCEHSADAALSRALSWLGAKCDK
jgi:hypothetical protein